MNFASIRQNLAAKLNNSADYLQKEVVPVLKERSTKAVDSVDSGMHMGNSWFVEFLINHPGISVSLATGTAIKQVAAYHVDHMIKQHEAGYQGMTVATRRVIVNSDSSLS